MTKRQQIIECLIVAGMIAVACLTIQVGFWWKTFRNDPNHSRQPVLTTVVEFATDWRAHKQ